MRFGIQHDHHIAKNVYRARALNPRENLLDTCKDGDVAIRQSQSLVVKRINRPFAESLQLLVYTARIGFSKGHADEIELAQRPASRDHPADPESCRKMCRCLRGAS